MKDSSKLTFILISFAVVTAVVLLVLNIQHQTQDNIAGSIVTTQAPSGLVDQNTTVRAAETLLPLTLSNESEKEHDLDAAAVPIGSSNRSNSQSRVLTGSELLLHKNKLLMDKIKLLTHKHALPNFAGLSSVNNKPKGSSARLSKQYNRYFCDNLTFNQLSLLSVDVGFRDASMQRIKRLEQQLLYQQRAIPEHAEQDIAPPSADSAQSLTLQELIENNFSAKKSEYETSDHVSQQQSARELEQIGAKYCYDLSRYIVNDFLNI